MAGRLRREGIYVYTQLINVVQQKQTQHCKAIILQLKKTIMKEKKVLHYLKKKKKIECSRNVLCCPQLAILSTLATPTSPDSPLLLAFVSFLPNSNVH